MSDPRTLLQDIADGAEEPTNLIVEQPRYFYQVPRSLIHDARAFLAAPAPPAPIDVERLARALDATLHPDLCVPPCLSVAQQTALDLAAAIARAYAGEGEAPE